jgi:hypothetical protein
MAVDVDYLLAHLEAKAVAWLPTSVLVGPKADTWEAVRATGLFPDEPSWHPQPVCPFCLEGVPFASGERFVCSTCLRSIDRHHLLAYSFSRERFVQWCARTWKIPGTCVALGDSLWQLGPHELGIVLVRWPGQLNDAESRRLSALKQAIVLVPRDPPVEVERAGHPHRSLLDLLRPTSPLTLHPLQRSIGPTQFEFDPTTGSLRIAEKLLGTVPVFSREAYLLDVLIQSTERFVPYDELKLRVLQHTGGTDERDDATFCHRLKHRLKQAIPDIDRWLITSGKGLGYRMHAEEP